MKKKRRKPMTAAELMEKLSKDEAYQAAIAEQDRQIEERMAANIQEQQELLSDWLLLE